MNKLVPVEHNHVRVLTTAQLAESFGSDTKIISKNFERNESRFTEGKHYFLLEGDELRLYKANRQIDDNLKFASSLYLWTEKGAWLHAKSLNTDRAWEAYEALVDDYYNVKELSIDTSLLSPEMQMFKHMFDGVARIQLEASQDRQKLAAVETKVEAIAIGLTATPDHTAVVARVNEYARWSRLGHNEVYNRIYDIMQAKHGIDVRQRVENERIRINNAHFDKTGKYFAASTLKQKVNGIDVMVRNGDLGKFNEILVGLLAKEKENSLPLY